MNPSRRCSSPARALALLLLSAPAAAQALTFERNAGQWPAALHARANVAGSSAWFHADGVTLQLRSGAAPQSVGSGERATVTTTVRMQFANGAQHAPPVSEETDATTCTSLRYRDVWPGIDTVFRGVDGRIAYEFDVVAGASAASIEFACEGLTAPLSIAADGSLVLTTAEGTLRHTTPHSFELGVDGERLAVPCAFALRGPHRFGFTVDRVDPERPLWIDPGIDWMTYFGGAGEDFLHFTTHVSGGLFAVTGVTDNTVPAPWNLGNPGGQGCYAALIDADSGNAVWSTALSGSGHDHVFGIDYNAANARVTVVGVTSSSDLPTTPDALQPTFGGTYDGFVAQLDLAGNLVYLSYVGGTGDDRICDVHVGNGIVTLAGVTHSPTLPMAGGSFQPALAGGSDAFVYQLDLSQPPTSQLVRSTFVGTANGQGASFNPNSYWKNFDNTHVHVAPSGEVTVALRTGSQLPALPTTAGALAANPSGGIDTWVGRFDPQLATLLAGTYLGGSNLDAALAMEVDDSGHVVLALTTASPNLATTPGAFDTTWAGSNDCYLCRLDLNATGASQLLYGTYFGGSDVDEPNGLVLAPSSDLVTVVGQTRPAGFGTAATPGAFQSTPQISTFNTSGFAIRLAMEGGGADDLHYASYLLPGGTTTALDVAQDEIGRAWIVGSTFATAVGTTTSGPQVNLVGANDGFAVRMDLLPDGVDAVGVGGPGCAATAYMQVDSQPRSGNSGFTMRCENAPPSAIGLLVLGAPAPTPVTVFGLDAYVQPITTPALLTDARGFASYDLPIPAGANGPYGIAAQFAWLPNNPCAGFLSTSNALRF